MQTSHRIFYNDILGPDGFSNILKYISQCRRNFLERPNILEFYFIAPPPLPRLHLAGCNTPLFLVLCFIGRCFAKPPAPPQEYNHRSERSPRRGKPQRDRRAFKHAAIKPKPKRERYALKHAVIIPKEQDFEGVSNTV